MIALIQRVRNASVSIEEQVAGQIGVGLLVFLGVEEGDSASEADRLLKKVLAYRVFPDSQGRMNLSLRDTGGGLLVISQFTLAADTSRGLRPGFSRAAAPQKAREMFEYWVDCARKAHEVVQTGQFGADMQVSLLNDGPVTFWLQIPPGS